MDHETSVNPFPSNRRFKMKFSIAALVVAGIAAGANAQPGVPIAIGDEYLWPEGLIPYAIDSSFDSKDKAQLKIAIKEYHAKTCIRWVSTRESETSYVKFVRKRKEVGCAYSDNCYYANTVRQATFQGCADSNTMIHEMGHALCFGHEQDRFDKEKFVNDICNPSSKYNHLNLGHLYDYRSAMHYGCSPGCLEPQMEGVSTNQCGSPKGLSVLDAEKLNDLYKCGGCKGYRYRFPYLIDSNSNPVVGGNHGSPTYICRAYVSGNIIPGKAALGGSWNCWVSHAGKEYGISNQEDFEILTNPQSVNLNWVRGGSSIPTNAIPGGRTVDAETLFTGRCRATKDSVTMVIPGKVFANNPSTMFYAYGGLEYSCTDFDILVCS